LALQALHIQKKLDFAIANANPATLGDPDGPIVKRVKIGRQDNPQCIPGTIAQGQFPYRGGCCVHMLVKKKGGAIKFVLALEPEN